MRCRGERATHVRSLSRSCASRFDVDSRRSQAGRLLLGGRLGSMGGRPAMRASSARLWCALAQAFNLTHRKTQLVEYKNIVCRPARGGTHRVLSRSVEGCG